MNIYEVFVALVQGIVEGLTEFLPVSSTGHLIVSGALLGFDGEKAKVFDVVIQAGAILAVCWVYRRKIAEVVAGLGRDPAARRLAGNIVLAFLPAALLGALFADGIKKFLFNPVSVAAAFVIGGVLILWAEGRKHRITVTEVDDAGWKDALKVGLAQCFALIPGTSRSGATIIGALLFGFSRRAATEFSFFLAIPTIFAAALYSGWKSRALFDVDDVPMLTVGFLAAFLSAIVAVRGLLKFISTHSFRALAWYRIVFGAVILITAHFGWVRWQE